MFGQNNNKLGKHAWLSVFFSVILGFAFIYLFCWYAVGIAHLVFYVFYVLLAIVGAVLVDAQKLREGSQVG